MPAGRKISLTEIIERAIGLRRAGNWSGAAQLYEEILSIRTEEFDSRHGEALHYLGVLEAQQGRLQEALRLIRRALTINPRDAKAHSNFGNVLLELRRHQEALSSYDRALELDPGDPIAWNGRGGVLYELKQYAQALASFDNALARDPNYAEAHNNRGNALLELKRHTEALACFEAALALRPDYAEAHHNRGNALLELERSAEALECHDRALALRPDSADFCNSRGNVLVQLKRYEAAAASYRNALALDPGYEYAMGALLHSKRRCCDWSGHDEECRRVVSGVRAGQNVIAPFAFLALSDSPQDQLACARLYAGRNEPHSAAPVWAGDRYRHDRIRVAYVSADFHEHPVSYLMVGVLERHDRRRFETIGISLRPDDGTPASRRIREALGNVVDVFGKSDAEIAALLRELQVDIAVDLMGHTYGSRTAVFAHRSAPVQVNYLGFPGTMGAPYMDYLIADPAVVPAGLQAHYAESVVYLPDCFQANDDRRTIATLKPARPAAGLPESGFVFCCFNNSYKISPPVFERWLGLLRGVPGSVLWLVAEQPVVARNLREEARRHGMDPERLVFAKHLPYADHLARMQLADLFLDTAPFNAGTTASDALYAGVPVLTTPGEAFASRMAASLVSAVGAPDLVAKDWEDYVRLALELATDAARLPEVKTRIARNRATCPLFDSDRFRRNLEAAYVAMWERSLRGEPPVSFAVP